MGNTHTFLTRSSTPETSPCLWNHDQNLEDIYLSERTPGCWGGSLQVKEERKKQQIRNQRLRKVQSDVQTEEKVKDLTEKNHEEKQKVHPG